MFYRLLKRLSSSFEYVLYALFLIYVLFFLILDMIMNVNSGSRFLEQIFQTL